VDKNYNGALFSEDNVVKEILSSQRLSGTGQFEDFDGRSVIGHFEKISDSNLFAVITTPMTLLTGVLDAYKRAAMFAALAIGLLGLIAAWIVGGTMSSSAPFVFKAVETESDEFADTNRDDEENPWIRAEASDISNKEFIEPENFAASMKTHKPEIRPEIRPDVKAGAKKESLLSGFNEERLKAERQTAFETVQKDFASRLREPLLAILGQAQLIQVKAKDDSIASHAGSIQREARLAKDALEKISSFDFNQTADSAIETTNEIADLEEVVSGALAAKALELQNLGVRIETYTDALSARGVTGELETALVHVIENSIEAMRDRDQKTLTISLRGSGEKAVLRISDTGIGMTQDTLSHAFEPFFRGFDSPRHMGLGLSFVQS
ncbi:MAG: HAMP domain-containing sensor histidine kinase, partial [Bdellovibrionota bacterium]